MSTFIERKQRILDTSGLLLFLSITHPNFSGPMNIVADTQNWTSNGVEYIGIPFRFKAPDDIAGQAPRAQLEMANVGTGLTEELEKLGPNPNVKAVLRIADRTNPDQIARTIRLPLVQVSVSGGTATGTMSVDGLMRQQAVKKRMNSFTAPGIH